MNTDGNKFHYRNEPSLIQRQHNDERREIDAQIGRRSRESDRLFAPLLRDERFMETERVTVAHLAVAVAVHVVEVRHGAGEVDADAARPVLPGKRDAVRAARLAHAVRVGDDDVEWEEVVERVLHDRRRAAHADATPVKAERHAHLLEDERVRDRPAERQAAAATRAEGVTQGHGTAGGGDAGLRNGRLPLQHGRRGSRRATEQREGVTQGYGTAGCRCNTGGGGHAGPRNGRLPPQHGRRGLILPVKSPQQLSLDPTAQYIGDKLKQCAI